MKKKCILVVDDDPTLRELLTEFLERLDFAVLSVESGEKAVLLVDTVKPYLILLDIILPGISGVDALQQLRALTPETLIVMISGQTDYAVSEQVLLQGAHEYVVKPIDLKFLEWVILEELPRKYGTSTSGGK